MKISLNHLVIALFLLLFLGCKVNQKTSNLPSDSAFLDDSIIQFTFLQINDVYEISPLEGGKIGGMARVATLYKQLKKENPNTLFVLAGDFLNPSLIGTLKYENKKIKGRQMVEILNACHLDLVTFGNHEFDVKESELQARMNESNFEWIGTNVLQVVIDQSYPGDTVLIPFHKEINGKKIFTPETFTWKIKDADGTMLKVGILGATIPKNKKPYVFYEDFMEEATDAYLELSSKTDLVFGLTHLEINEDLQLAAELPNVALLMGGHDHHNMKHEIGNVVITKADANAKSAYVHRVTYNKKEQTYTLNSELVEINEQLSFDPAVQLLVDKWSKILNDNLKKIYPNPEEIVYNSPVKLDGRESSIRLQQTKLGDIFTAGFAAAAQQKADLAIMNSGSIRLDDQLEGQIQAIDIFRAMPFGGQVWELDIKGADLQKLLHIGLNEQYGKGGFLQTHNVKLDAANKTWLIGQKPINPTHTYHLALNDYVYSRSESLGALLKNLAVTKPEKEATDDPRSDLRVAVIQYMKGL